jgi:ABC-type uncharacterized transport system permease subunit
MPGAVAQGMIWGIMAIGLYITYSVLNFSDLTVDGTMATGGAVCIMLMMAGVNMWVALLCAVIAGMLAGLVTGLFHTAMGIPGILSGILTQLSLYSVNLVIMGGKANQAVSVRKYDLIVSSRYVRDLSVQNPIFITLIIIAVLIIVVYRIYRVRRKLRPGTGFLLMLGSVVLLRFGLLANHSYMHSFFTYRALASTILAILVAMLINLQSRKKGGRSAWN